MSKIITVVMVIAVLFCILFESAACEQGIDADELYANVAIVSGFQFEEDLVLLTDTSGSTWAMYGIEDWRLGDIACLVVWNAGTALIFDDEIVCATYNGSVSDLTEVLESVINVVSLSAELEP